MHARSALLALAASAGYAAALSTGCTTEIGVLALGDLGSCLQLTSLLPLLSSSGSVVDSLNTYLSSLCASSTTTCSNSTLTSAASSISSSCSSDISSGGTDAAEIEGLLLLIDDYPEVYAGGCSKNSTTGDYCLVDALTTVQTASGSNLTLSSITSILSGGNYTSLESAYTSGALCTGCVSGLYYEALQANSSLANTTLGQGLTSKCGSSFGTTAPNTTTTSSSSSSSAASSTSSSSAGQLGASPFAALGSAALIAGSAVGAVALGFAAVL